MSRHPPPVPSVTWVRGHTPPTVIIKVIMAVSGDLTNSELELHVNTAHLDFLTPDSEEKLYLEDGGDSDWGSLWDLDKVDHRERGSIMQCGDSAHFIIR